MRIKGGRRVWSLSMKTFDDKRVSGHNACDALCLGSDWREAVEKFLQYELPHLLKLPIGSALPNGRYHLALHEVRLDEERIRPDLEAHNKKKVLVTVMNGEISIEEV